MTGTTRKKMLLTLELVGLFLGLPAALSLAMGIFNPVPLLLVAGAVAAWYLFKRHAFRARHFGGLTTVRRFWPQFAVVCVLMALAGTVLLLALNPQSLFSLPRRSFTLWLSVLVFYSLIAVYPQELIYRAFFFQRYRSLFASDHLLIAASSLAFGFGHIIYGNVVAVGLAAAGGLLFGLTYQRSRSVMVVTVEHALYGCMLYTLGLGPYISSGGLRLL